MLDAHKADVYEDSHIVLAHDRSCCWADHVAVSLFWW